MRRILALCLLVSLVCAVSYAQDAVQDHEGWVSIRASMIIKPEHVASAQKALSAIVADIRSKGVTPSHIEFRQREGPKRIPPNTSAEHRESLLNTAFWSFFIDERLSSTDAATYYVIVAKGLAAAKRDGVIKDIRGLSMTIMQSH